MPEIKFFNYHAMSENQIYNLTKARWLARTDLKFLCNQILGYKDVCEEVHGSLINTLQKFPVPNEQQFRQNDNLSTGFVKYKPIVPLDIFVEQEKCKRRLIIDFRGSLKTSLNAIAHTIQWILNYPNIGILIVQSNIEKAEEILLEVKNNFAYNAKFRDLFPEHVPQKKLNDWGTKSVMITEAADMNNMDLGRYHKEGTIITGGIEKGLAGKHLDVLKFSDIVDPSNSKTDSSCAEIIKQYYLAENLLTSPIYWIDVEGTRYSFADLYGKIIKDEARLPEERRVWKIYLRGCYKKKTKDGKPQKFTPDELFLDDLTDDSLKNSQNPEGKISWWPKRYPPEVLEHKRHVSPYEFSTQMYNNPRSAEDGMVPFPVTDKLPVLMKRDIFDKNVPKAFYEISIDTAETDNQKSNYTSIAVGCFTGAGNVVIVDIIHGKFLPDKLIDKIYQCYLKYKPKSIKIEETSFVRGLMAGIRKEGERLGIYLPIDLIKRENQIAKQERILNTLQPYYAKGQLRFIDDLEAMDALKEELLEFPTGSRDDILDSITDLFQNKEYFGRETARLEDIMIENQDRGRRLVQEYQKAYPVMVQTWLDTGLNTQSPYVSNTYDRTGGL
jgi:predicted phage terminase large subunit-like protein